jgi:hypothetical protein
MKDYDDVTSLSDALARIFWMMVGPLALTLLAFTIIRIGSGWLTWADMAYLGVLGGMLLARWVEFRGGNPKTGDGQPATPIHLRRYIQSTVPLGVGMWVVANVIGNHLLNR